MNRSTKSDSMDCILIEHGLIDCAIISLFVTRSARFHDAHRTHLRLPQGKRSVVDQMDGVECSVDIGMMWALPYLRSKSAFGRSQ